MVAVVLHIERRKGFVTSGYLFNFWLIATLVDIIVSYSIIMNAIRQVSVISKQVSSGY